jgi:phenylacetate-coenzyme A ligase PaaK-like adenylate-forming protein
LLAYQQDSLKKALRHAAGASAHYRETIGHLVARGASLAEFPVMTKRTLMANFDRVVTDQRLNRAMIERHLDGPEPGAMLLGEYRAAATGGTTGERGVFAYNDCAWLSVIANIVRFQRTQAIGAATRSVGIAASSPIHLSYRFNAEARALRPGSPKLDLLMPIPHIVETLNAYQPEALVTYPSFIRVLANEQLAQRLRISPRIVRSGAETLTQEVRNLARQAWGVTVINSYSCTEVGMMGQECEYASGLHLAEDLCVFEVVDEDHHPVPEGARGAKLLVTTLTNEILPLVRYELTDIVTMTTAPCRCGLPFARLSAIEGRKEDVIRLPRKGGGHVDIHAIRLHSPLIGTEGIRQFQVARLSDGLEILISVQTDFDAEAVRQKVEHMMRDVLDKLDASPARFEIRIVAQIERTGSALKEKLIAQPRSP